MEHGRQKLEVKLECTWSVPGVYLEYLKLCLELYRNLNIYLTHIPDILFNLENLDLVWLAIGLKEPDIAVGK